MGCVWEIMGEGCWEYFGEGRRVIPKVVFDSDCGVIDNLEGVAPTVERWTPNPTVVGSNPIALTFYLFHFFHLYTTPYHHISLIHPNLPPNLRLFFLTIAKTHKKFHPKNIIFHIRNSSQKNVLNLKIPKMQIPPNRNHNKLLLPKYTLSYPKLAALPNSVLHAFVIIPKLIMLLILNLSMSY